jgi:16S rRNA (uracil1498-N3)-methyltransferase
MSSPIRLFVTAPLYAGATVAATAAQAHQLAHVMRRSLGDPVHLFNAVEGEWQGRITSLRRDRCDVTVEHRRRAQQPEPGPALLFALLKRDATDLVVRQATELGAVLLQPVITARTNAARVNQERLSAIATEAAEQCERLSVPVLRAPAPLDDVLAQWDPAHPLAAAFDRGGAALAAPAQGLLVGPEGGFTEAELDAIRRHPFVVPISLGPRILRAETAAIAGLALLQARLPQPSP